MKSSCWAINSVEKTENPSGRTDSKIGVRAILAREMIPKYAGFFLKRDKNILRKRFQQKQFFIIVQNEKHAGVYSYNGYALKADSNRSSAGIL